MSDTNNISLRGSSVNLAALQGSIMTGISIKDDMLTMSAEIDSLSQSLGNHADDRSMHVTPAEKKLWNTMAAGGGDISEKIAEEFTEHITDTDIHTSVSDKTRWNTHVSDSSRHVTATDKANWDGHMGNDGIHVSTSDRQTWNAKQDSISDLSDIRSKANAAAGLVQAEATARASDVSTLRGLINGKQDIIADLSAIRSGVNNVSNPNLLDNWYFAKAVNQRNVSGYSTTTKFFVDRWFADEVDCVFSDANNEGAGYISIKAKNSTTVAINQYIPRILRPGKYTASWIFINAVGSSLHTATIDYTNDGAWHSAAISTVSGTVVKMRSNTLNTTRTEFRIERTSALGEQFGIVAVKLEIGDKQTLAHSENGKWVMNEIPDYAEQLRRCQRYYYRSWGTSTSTAVAREGSLSFTAGTTWSTPGVIEYPVEMYLAPSVVLYNPVTGATGSIRNWAKSTDVAATTTYANNKRCAVTNADGKIVIGECYAFHYEAIISGFGG